MSEIQRNHLGTLEDAIERADIGRSDEFIVAAVPRGRDAPIAMISSSGPVTTFMLMRSIVRMFLEMARDNAGDRGRMLVTYLMSALLALETTNEQQLREVANAGGSVFGFLTETALYRKTDIAKACAEIGVGALGEITGNARRDGQNDLRADPAGDWSSNDVLD